MALPWIAVWDPPRPHVHPLRTRSGRVVSSNAPVDHPWHHGLWSTIKFVNGANFWEEYGEFGVLSPVDIAVAGPTTTATLDWIAPGGGAVAVHETRTLRQVALSDAAYAIDWTFALRPTADTVFDRTPFTTWGGYGGLTLRGAPDWTDTVLHLAPGVDHGRPVLGTPASWCALASDAATVAIVDHPANPRYPTPWYGSTRADTYGEGWANFLNAAFLWEGPLQVGAGEELARRHRVIVADGRLSADEIEGWSHEWRDQ